MPPHAPRLAYVLLTLTALFWSGNFVLARAMHAAVPPMSLSFGRWLIAFALLAPMALPRAWRCRQAIRAQFGRVLALSVLGVAAFNSLVYTGVQTTTATNAVLLNSFIPLLTVLFGALAFGQRLGRWQGVGLAVSFIGVLAIVSHGEWARLVGLNLNQGDVLVFSAMVCLAFYTLLLRGVSPDIDRMGLMGVMTALGLLVILPFFAWEISSGRLPTSTPATWATFAYVGIFPSVFAYLFFNYGVAQVGPARAAMFTHLMPVFGALLSFVFLGEGLAGYHFVGIGAIFAGLLLSSRRG